MVNDGVSVCAQNKAVSNSIRNSDGQSVQRVLMQLLRVNDSRLTGLPIVFPIYIENKQYFPTIHIILHDNVNYAFVLRDFIENFFSFFFQEFRGELTKNFIMTFVFFCKNELMLITRCKQWIDQNITLQVVDVAKGKSNLLHRTFVNVKRTKTHK